MRGLNLLGETLLFIIDWLVCQRVQSFNLLQKTHTYTGEGKSSDRMLKVEIFFNFAEETN